MVVDHERDHSSFERCLAQLDCLRLAALLCVGPRVSIEYIGPLVEADMEP